MLPAIGLSTGGDIRDRALDAARVIRSCTACRIYELGGELYAPREIARISTRDVGAVRIPRVGGRYTLTVLNESCDSAEIQ